MKECQTCKSCYADSVSHCPKDGMPTFHSITGEPILEEKYQLESRIGQGGMGVVYKATHKYLKTFYAVKVILPDLVGNDPQLVTRLRQEALAAAAIRHHNVVAVTDYGVIEGKLPYLVMEYVEGESLHDLLAREKRLSPERACEIMSAICAGVDAAHKQGIVHRDLKPLNVMILKGRPMAEAVKILDFGLAKIKSGELLGSFIQAQTTGLMGSPYYMSPEQWADEEPDAHSDVYSLGVILFQMLCGEVPFKGSSIPAIMKKHISDPPPSFASFGVSLPPEIENVVKHSLAKNRNERTQSVLAIAEELKVAIGQSMNSATIPFIPNQNNVLTNQAQNTQNQDVGLISQQANTFGSISHQTPNNLANQTQGGIQSDQTNFQQNQQSFIAQPNLNPKPFPVLVFGIIGIFGLLLLTGIGVFGAYMLGLFGKGEVVVSNSNTNTKSTNSNSNVQKNDEPVLLKNQEMVKIPGGKFMMGNNKGEPQELPEHEVLVKDFSMDKTEVTNAEYEQFVKDAKYPAPSNWKENKPIVGEEMFPVTFVGLKDTKAFAEWRSKKYGKTFRLPTEAEWEYAARNGEDEKLYPWGDNYEKGKAVFDEQNQPQKVDSMPDGKNKWGVVDLIGNVWEWTSDPLEPYPNNPNAKNFDKSQAVGRYIVRGGAYSSLSSGKGAITATSRVGWKPGEPDKRVGFRLVMVE
jgi:serine/threonine protein kinase